MSTPAADPTIRTRVLFPLLITHELRSVFCVLDLEVAHTGQCFCRNICSIDPLQDIEVETSQRGCQSHSI